MVLGWITRVVGFRSRWVGVGDPGPGMNRSLTRIDLKRADAFGCDPCQFLLQGCL